MLAGLTREIDVMEATIVEALRLQTGQLSGYAAQSAKAVTGALDAQTKLQAQIAREVEETRAMRARRPTDSGCAAITGLAGLAATRQAAESAYVRAAGAETGRIAGDRAAVPDAGAAAGNAARFESLTPRFPDGLTVLDAAGQWRDGSGAIMRERTKLVIVLAKPGAAEVRHTVEIAEAYKRSFGQKAVLRTMTPACVSF